MVESATMVAPPAHRETLELRNIREDGELEVRDRVPTNSSWGQESGDAVLLQHEEVGAQEEA